MKRFILGLIVGFAVLFAVVFIYFTMGFAPVAAAAKPMPFERYLLGHSLFAKIRSEAPKTVPVEATPENLVEGAKVFKQNCAFCHGLPRASASPEGRGMYPHAPQFFVPRRNVARFRGPRKPPTAQQRAMFMGFDYWRVKNGIRMTGMPSFEKALSNQQIWDVVLMLNHRRNLPPAASEVLSPAPAASSTPASGTPAKPAAAPKRPSK